MFEGIFGRDGITTDWYLYIGDTRYSGSFYHSSSCYYIEASIYSHSIEAFIHRTHCGIDKNLITSVSDTSIRIPLPNTKTKALYRLKHDKPDIIPCQDFQEYICLLYNLYTESNIERIIWMETFVYKHIRRV